MSVPEDTYDELAGVVDLFGALTRAELRDALDELAFKRGQGADAAALRSAVEDAVDRYYLVEFDPDSETESGAETLLVPGPVAFPILPEDAEDLPLILDVPDRDVNREVVGEQVAERLAADAERVVGSEGGTGVTATDEERAEHLLDVSYDLEAWAPVEATAARETLDEALGAKTEEPLG
jgi:hypothetical protein